MAPTADLFPRRCEMRPASSKSASARRSSMASLPLELHLERSPRGPARRPRRSPRLRFGAGRGFRNTPDTHLISQQQQNENQNNATLSDADTRSSRRTAQHKSQHYAALVRRPARPQLHVTSSPGLSTPPYSITHLHLSSSSSPPPPPPPPPPPSSPPHLLLLHHSPPPLPPPSSTLHLFPPHYTTPTSPPSNPHHLILSSSSTSTTPLLTSTSSSSTPPSSPPPPFPPPLLHCYPQHLTSTSNPSPPPPSHLHFISSSTLLSSSTPPPHPSSSHLHSSSTSTQPTIHLPSPTTSPSSSCYHTPHINPPHPLLPTPLLPPPPLLPSLTPFLYHFLSTRPTPSYPTYPSSPNSSPTPLLQSSHCFPVKAILPPPIPLPLPFLFLPPPSPSLTSHTRPPSLPSTSYLPPKHHTTHNPPPWAWRLMGGSQRITHHLRTPPVNGRLRPTTTPGVYDPYLERREKAKATRPNPIHKTQTKSQIIEYPRNPSS
ncbi:hypothetical protein C7M84_014013 [Penaeus vannamei]|uniref:Uncharacterized protein n=1 Tax=Penaeus vannamei TaxID=6689 RepID=A0A3R7LZZ2_PENVA|nr:hypothetical protein C7M84_014013 [Penaeus vannamei]